MISLIQGWISGNGEVQRMEYDAFKDGISEKRFRGWVSGIGRGSMDRI
ncbi:MAG: hypothetical protein ACXWCG_00580 [Flavitalea sp.]